MNQKDLELKKKALLSRKKEIIDQLSEFSNASKEVETGLVQDVGDKAESSYTKEFLLNLSDTERQQLVMIDDALKRIDRGEYGICSNCGKEIGMKRLGAVPWASLCISCKELEEQGLI